MKELDLLEILVDQVIYILAEDCKFFKGKYLLLHFPPF